MNLTITRAARGNDAASATPPLVAKQPRYAARKANGSSSHFIAIFFSFIAIKWCCQDMELSVVSTTVGGTQGHHATGNGVLWRILAAGLRVLSVGAENIDVATLWSLRQIQKNVGSCGVGCHMLECRRLHVGGAKVANSVSEHVVARSRRSYVVFVTVCFSTLLASSDGDATTVAPDANTRNSLEINQVASGRLTHRLTVECRYFFTLATKLLPP